MDTIKKNLALGFISITLSLLLIGSIYAASSGTYISESIGEADVTSFKTLELIDQNLPEGTDIKYSFAGSKDDYAAWSKETTIDKIFDLSGVEELKSGGYIKIKITMISSSTESPSLKGFKVTYIIGGGDTITKTSSVSTTSTSNSGSSGSTTTAKLVSTGGSLWFNVLIALVITGLIAFFVLRKKHPKEIQKSPEPPQTYDSEIK